MLLFCLVQYDGSEKRNVTGSAMPAGLCRLLLTPEIAGDHRRYLGAEGRLSTSSGDSQSSLRWKEKIMAPSKQRRYDSGNLPERSGKGHSSVRKTTEPINKR